MFGSTQAGCTIDLSQGSLIAIGFAAAFVSALIVVKTFLGFVSRHGYALFGWWRIAVGAVGMFLVARNNKSKAIRAFDKADEYKNYMTKWYDDVKKDKKE